MAGTMRKNPGRHYKAARRKGIRVEYTQDRMGGLVLTPVSKAARKKIAAYLKQWKVKSDGTAYLQPGDEAEYEIETTLSRAQARDVRAGWTVTVTLDPWVFLHHYGWDAHEGVRLNPRKKRAARKKAFAKIHKRGREWTAEPTDSRYFHLATAGDTPEEALVFLKEDARRSGCKVRFVPLIWTGSDWVEGA